MALVIGFRVYSVLCFRDPRIIKKWEQPEDIRYDDQGPYALAFVSDGVELRWGLAKAYWSRAITIGGHFFCREMIFEATWRNVGSSGTKGALVSLSTQAVESI